MVSTSFPSVLVLGTLISTSLQLDGCFKEEPSPEPSPTVQYGGMWIPGQLSDPAHQTKLRELGFELPATAYNDLLGYPMGAIANVGGCSGSFVSKTGLIVTNHHCVQGRLPGLSQEGENLLKSGFIAHRQEQERLAPGFSGSILMSSADVTKQILAGVDPLMDESSRWMTVTANSSRLLSTCRSEHPNLSCDLKTYFDENHYELQVSQPLTDLRLVYVPPEGLGWFGGDQDNWRWPRQTSDFAFLRAYGPDGQPWTPPAHLRIAAEPLAPADPVMVAGYPGQTSRYRSGARVKFAQEHRYPYGIGRLTEQIELAKGLIAQDPTLEPRLISWIFSLSNALINYRATLEGFNRSQFADERLMRDAMLDQWIHASPERALRFGSVIEQLAALIALEVPNYRIDLDVNGMAYRTIMLRRALSIIDQAKARAQGAVTQPEQIREFVAKFNQDSNPGYNIPGLDRALLELLMIRLAKVKPEGEPRARAILGLSPSDGLKEDDVRKAVAALYDTTQLDQLASAQALFEGATLDDLSASTDGFVRAALALDPILDEIEAAKPQDERELKRLRRLYTQARVEFAREQQELVAPDANGTLRISYGQVKGYSPLDQNFTYPPFSTSAELLAKHTGEPPFALPEVVVDALKKRDFGRYFDPRIGDLPVNFLSTIDATGGNSGSATINKRGELVGLLFDGNYEGVMSDWQLDPDLARSIHVDLRFVLWTLDTVIPSHRLLREMGIEPRTQSVTAQRYEFAYEE